MTSDRKTHVISRMLSYLFNSDMSDEQLFDVLHNRVGMSKEELNDFSIKGLDSLLLFLPGDVVGIAEGVAHLDDLAVGVLQVGIVDEEYLEITCLGVADTEAKQQ